MSNPYDRPFTLDKFDPSLGQDEAWVGFDNMGHAFNATVYVNTTVVQPILHSLKATPSFFIVQEKAATAIATGTGYVGFTAIEASASDTSCIRITCQTASGGDALSAAARVIVFR